MKRVLFFLILLPFFWQTSAFSEENGCVSCHKTLTEPQQKLMFAKWDRSPHQEAGIFCNDCHSGDPKASQKEAAHKDANFGNPALERVSPRNISETCGGCHLSVYDEFRSSKHYKNLAKEKMTPTCGNCHYDQQGRTIDHSRLSDFCNDCHKMTAKGSRFFLTFDAVLNKKLSDETKKSLATAKKMMEFQLSAKTRTVSEKNIQLARKIMTIAEVNLHNNATLWHHFQAEDVSRNSEKAHYLALTAIDLLLPGK